MTRYVTRVFWVEDEHFMPEMRHDPLPDATERGPIDTGLIDRYGHTIMRMPEPIGFGRREGYVD
jgi:hypothetical protein